MDFFFLLQNSAPRPGNGQSGGQALAMRISGDKAAFYNCQIKGFQDTLCSDHGRHLFKNCHIVGTVDFIFGSGTALFLVQSYQTKILFSKQLYNCKTIKIM